MIEFQVPCQSVPCSVGISSCELVCKEFSYVVSCVYSFLVASAINTNVPEFGVLPPRSPFTFFDLLFVVFVY